MEFPQKPKNRPTIWFSNSIPGCISGTKKTLFQKDTCTPNVHNSTAHCTEYCILFHTIAKIWKQRKYSSTDSHKKERNRASLVAQWWRICLSIQGIRVWSLIWENPTCCDTTKLGASTTEPVLLSPGATATEVACPRAHALQQEKPPQWESRVQ